jgi:hypothetical protein
MSMQEYKKLIEDFCEAAEIEDVGGMLHRGLIDIDGTPARLQYVEAGDHCRVLADLGAVPDDLEADIHEIMLEFNFNNNSPALPLFSMHPDTRHAVLLLHVPITGLVGQSSLAEMIDKELTPRVNRWVEMLEEIRDTPSNNDDIQLPVGMFA